jgi:hypothetical protein
MALQLGDLAPDFETETTDGPIRLHDLPGAPGLALSRPGPEGSTGH